MGANELKRLMVRLSSFFIVQQTHVALGLAHQHWFMLTLANSPVATTWLSNFHMRASPMSPTFTVNLIRQPGSSNTWGARPGLNLKAGGGSPPQVGPLLANCLLTLAC